MLSRWPSLENRGTGTPEIGCIRAIVSCFRHWRATQTTTKQTNTQTNKQTNTQTNKQTNKHTNQTNKPTNKPTKHTCMSSKPGHVRNCSKLPGAVRRPVLLHRSCSTEAAPPFAQLLHRSCSTDAAPPKLLHQTLLSSTSKHLHRSCSIPKSDEIQISNFYPNLILRLLGK